MQTTGELRIDGKRLELILLKRDMSLKQVAEKMGMHYNSVLRMKTEGSTNLRTLQQLCNALECHPFDLLVAEGYPQPFYPAPVSL